MKSSMRILAVLVMPLGVLTVFAGQAANTLGASTLNFPRLGFTLL